MELLGYRTGGRHLQDLVDFTLGAGVVLPPLAQRARVPTLLALVADDLDLDVGLVMAALEVAQRGCVHLLLLWRLLRAQTGSHAGLL